MNDTFVATAGEKCQVACFVSEEWDYDPLPDASDALRRLCRQRGFKPYDIHLVSSEPWTEPIGDVQPKPGFTLRRYEATALPETWT